MASLTAYFRLVFCQPDPESKWGYETLYSETFPLDFYSDFKYHSQDWADSALSDGVDWAYLVEFLKQHNIEYDSTKVYEIFGKMDISGWTDREGEYDEEVVLSDTSIRILTEDEVKYFSGDENISDEDPNNGGLLM